MNLSDLVRKVCELGYETNNAEARVCQDIILRAISKSNLSRNVTIKGGVVMRSITNNVRRATQDMDIDFIRYSLSDESIDNFIAKLNCLDGITITRVGEIEELNQQDYKGKRVHVHIKDVYNNFIESKIDLGVHKHMEIKQEDYCFDIAFDDEGASLLINTKEQMFAEKLRSLLKFGIFNTRYKDIYDMYYQCGRMDTQKLIECLHVFIFDDVKMRENNLSDILKRLNSIFKNELYKERVDKSDKRWLDIDIDDIFNEIIGYLNNLR